DEHLSQLSALKSPSEKDMMVTASLFRLLKQNAKADSISKAILEHFPIGETAFAGQLAGLQKQTDPEILEQGLNDLVTKFKLDLSQKASESKIASIYNVLAISYGQQKNWKKVDFYAGKITDKVRLASVYNTIAWPLAELNQETQAASALSKKSLALIEAAKADEHPFYTTREQYLENLDRSYLMYADTYALLLHNQGNDKEAVKYQEMALDFSDNAGLERYVMYLDLSGSKDKAFSEAERIIKEGKGTEALKARFKTLYESKKLAVPFESYLAKIEQSLIEKEKKEWIGKMTNEPAPSFSLVNRKGETVSLASLKGKVIVLDYWATWCGPCVASFPGMQKAVTKYAADPNVVFLFVNTWQREANREEVVNKFFAENKYEFNVLYDTRNKDNPEVFDVIAAYKVKGIPTKFIIDKQGKIRFTVVGHSSEKDVVKEMDLLISLASSEQSK
ncbi:MAG: TlpA family protein disulfide reductase, partial [Sphingobacteriales bacterium]